jgi:predicted RND superfamily exporter protein
VLLLSLLAIIPLPLGYDDDVIRFLPVDDPEIVRLKAINERFGSIHVALIGIESDNLFSAEVLGFTRTLSKRLKSVREVANITSISEFTIIDNTKEDGEDTTVLRALVPDPVPTDAKRLEALRKNVLSYDYLVGSLVSHDGTAASMICQLYEELDGEYLSPKKGAEAIREALAELQTPSTVTLHFGGGPFISESVANGSQRDLRRLAPYVCGVILLLVFLTLGSVKAAILALTCVGIGILWTLGLMGWLGQSLTLVSSSLPIILVALGSAYAVHLLVWYMEHGGDIKEMLTSVGWPVAIASLTTVAGFVSFLVMDIAPMREFGWQMAAGTGICGLVTLLVIPSVLHRWPIPKRENRPIAERVDRWLVGLADKCQKGRVWVLCATAVVVVFFAFQLPGVEARMDASSFFPEGSAPLIADRFLTKHFGGSVYLQVLVTGDLKEPAVLRQMAAFEDRLVRVKGVTRVQSITKILALVTEAQTGYRRIPRKRGTVEQLGKLAFDSDLAVELLVDQQWTGALIQVGIGGFDTRVVREVTQRIRALMKTHLPERVALVRNSNALAPIVIQDAAERIVAISFLASSFQSKLEKALHQGRNAKAQSFAKGIHKILLREIDDEEMVRLKDGSNLLAMAEQLDKQVAGGLSAEAFLQHMTRWAHAEEMEDKVGFNKGVRLIYRQIQDHVQSSLQAATMGPIKLLLGEQPKAVIQRVGNIVADVLASEWLVASDNAPSGSTVHSLTAQASGYPIVQEALSRSVHRNQIVSILTSLPLILLILCLVFRSIPAGIIALVPTGLTLLVTFGLMGAFSEQLPLDIGGSMLASIALGVGIDYSIHFLWRYRETGLQDAMHTTGRSIVINAVEITAGFAVLMWASIAPMSRFGLLIAVTLLVAAVSTLILLPAMLSWWKPASAADSGGI